ncbi:tetratricopeptide repeat protein [Winogradskyella sp. DF17]|uniref:Oxygen sensor histidine kinase NreB n=1 Tax=Winogradskyella pelagia TaxID=2819984 RepID=A0ABS3T0I2_9FLAO|nr:ATP-binding protein [Winogradskyella sp. DF17]MBO3116243.1 tetratricopeptide repeat protein [Winogradskyella sp. DF17]
MLLSFALKAQENTYFTLTELDSIFNAEAYSDIIGLDVSQIKTVNKQELAEANFIFGKSFENLNKEDQAVNLYKKALELYTELGDTEQVARLNLELYLTIDSQNNLEVKNTDYLNKVYEHAKTNNSVKWLSVYYTNYGVEMLKANQGDSAKYYFEEALDLAQQIDSTRMQTNIAINLGSTYSRKFRNQDSAIIYYNQALKYYFSDTLNYKDLNTAFNIYNNIGNAYRRKKEYQKALDYYFMAEAIDLPKLNSKSKKILYSNMDITYYYLKDWPKAYDYLYKYDSIKDVINLKEQNSAITEIEERYDNEKLRADNLESEAKRKQNQNIAIGLGGSLALGSIIAFLVFKNVKRKQKLTEQAKKLQSQKLSTVLKEQELKAIDAMIEGQEKERQRIANDLHDDLGGMMATVKLHFDALKRDASKDLFEKTNKLINEAYQKVRTVAHVKNSGVMAKQGLLKAVQHLADTISASNQIDIEVVDHGLDQRLENSLELTLFRVIQELVTNIIKHAEATEATIHLTHHDDSINIMVEDNGKGFNPKQITKMNYGMGISSIDKRVEHLDGKLSIESELNKGTTVIIDIPL